MNYRVLFAALALAVLAAAFSRQAAADHTCGVCLYEHTSFRGASHCVYPSAHESALRIGHFFDKEITNLKAEDFNDKTSSLKLIKTSCPNLAVVLYDNDNFGGKRLVLNKSTRSIGSDLNDKVTSVQVMTEGFGMPAKAYSCGVCLFDQVAYFGRSRCVDGKRDKLKHSDSALAFNDKAKSIKLYKAESCPNLAATLFEKDDYKGKKLSVTVDFPALGNLGGKVSSLEVFKDGIADPKDCGICLYEHTGFRGAEYCAATNEADLHREGFNDKASSIKLFKKTCPNLAVQLWDNDAFKGDSYRVLNASARSVGGKLNDKITSFKLFRNGTDGPWSETNGCGACVFQHEDYSGAWACTSSTIGDLGETDVKRDKATSLWIDKKKCPKAEVTLAEDRNIGGKMLVLSSSMSNLADKNFSDKADSLSFKETAGSSVTDLDCGVCLYENTRYGGGWYCAAGDAEVADLKEQGFNDKAQSVKLIKKSCPNLEVALYDNDNYKGTRLIVTESKRAIGNGLGDKITSFQAFSKGFGTPGDAPDCGICLFDQVGYYGNSECYGRVVASSLKGGYHPFNDKAKSVKLYKNTCPDMGVMLYEHENYLGKRLQLAADSIGLGDLGGKVSSLKVVPDGLPDPKECGICLYEDSGFNGSEYCTTVNESDLSNVDFNDKVSSIRLYKKTCPKLSITVYDKKEYVATHGTKVRFVGDSISMVPGSLNDKISSITLHPQGDNDLDPVELTGGCGACVYEDTGYVGRHLCLKDDEMREEIDTTGQIRIPNNTTILENDKVSSVWVETSKCRKGKVVLYEDRGFGGKALALDESVNNLESKNFDDKVSSFLFSKSGDTSSPNATNGCGVCLYENVGFKGTSKCFGRDVGTLKDYDFNDKTSSVKVDKKKCPKLAVKLWDGSNYAVYDPPWENRGADQRIGLSAPDKFRLLNASVKYVGDKLNDKISSLKVYPDGYDDAPWSETNGCGTCLFQHEDFSGPWACTTGSISDLGTTSLKRDEATSIWIDDKKCSNAQVTLYKDRNLGGDSLTVAGSLSHLGDKKFSDTVDSVVFDKTGTEAAMAGAPDCGICLYEDTGYRGQRLCLEPNEDNTTDLRRPNRENYTSFSDLKENGFGDKASSVKLFKKSCPSLEAELFKDKEFKNTDQRITGDDRDLGQLKGEVSSVKLYRWGVLQARHDINGCGWCAHDKKSYKGTYTCQRGGPGTSRPMLDETWGLRDKASSIQVFTETCPGAKLWLYDQEEVGTGNALILGKSANLSSGFDNKIRQAVFTYAPKATCGFCAYEQPNYKGQGLCMSWPNVLNPGRLTIPALPKMASVLAGNIRSLQVHGNCGSGVKVISAENTFAVTGSVPSNEGKWTLPVSQVTTR